jgi:type II secretory pathway pseudopilin PulG
MQQQRQSGISLVGLIVVIAILGFVGVLGMKIIPTYTEYRAIMGAVERAKRDGGDSAKAIIDSYNKSAEVGYITSLKSSDLIIDRQGGEVEISFEYEKKIPLFGPASILLEYSGTTAKGGPQKKVE